MWKWLKFILGHLSLYQNMLEEREYRIASLKLRSKAYSASLGVSFEAILKFLESYSISTFRDNCFILNSSTGRWGAFPQSTSPKSSRTPTGLGGFRDRQISKDAWAET